MLQLFKYCIEDEKNVIDSLFLKTTKIRKNIKKLL